jgi:hypothetical protein
MSSAERSAVAARVCDGDSGKQLHQLLEVFEAPSPDGSAVSVQIRGTVEVGWWTNRFSTIRYCRRGMGRFCQWYSFKHADPLVFHGL